MATNKLTHIASPLRSLLLAVFVANLSFLVPSAVADDSSKILRKLELMEAEISALKAELKEQKAQQTKSLEAAAVVKKGDTVSDSENASKGFDEALFRPQSQSLASNAEASEALNKRIKELGQFGITYRSNAFTADSMRLGAYGESIFGRKDSGNGWNNGFDANRMVLLGTYQISDDIIFNTEIEFEHGGIAKDADDKLNGALEVEQLFIDFKANDYFTWRSPGVDVVPIGYINLFHEPTQFYSANRPELYDGLIPSTWFAPTTGAYGKVVDGVNYQFQVSSALEDAGTVADEEGGSVPAGGYDAGISGTEALSLSRAPIGDRLQLSNNLAYTLRLSYLTPAIPGLSGSTSFYYTSDTTPRGAYGTNANGSTRPLGRSDLGMFDTELRYRMPESGVELRSEFIQTNFGDTDNLRANNDGDSTNNVGSSMYGYSFEAAYHLDLVPTGKERWELVPFYRYSFIDLQTSGVHGTDSNNPTGAGTNRYHTFGAALFPTPKIVLKADYQFILDDDMQTANEKALLGAVGFFF